MLFLAGGQASLKRDPVSVACLVLAMSPRYPHCANDQRYNLLAWRHLAVLGAERRLIQPIDVSNNFPVSLDVQVSWFGWFANVSD